MDNNTFLMKCLPWVSLVQLQSMVQHSILIGAAHHASSSLVMDKALFLVLLYTEMECIM